MASTLESSLRMDLTFEISLPSSVLSTEDQLYLEKKRLQLKAKKITLVSDNKISEVWAFYFKVWRNEMRKILTGQNLRLTARFCLQTATVTAHYRILISSAVLTRNTILHVVGFLDLPLMIEKIHLRFKICIA